MSTVCLGDRGGEAQMALVCLEMEDLEMEYRDMQKTAVECVCFLMTI